MARVVHDSKGFPPDKGHQSVVDKVMKLAEPLWIDEVNDMTLYDEHDLINAYLQPLKDEDLTR